MYHAMIPHVDHRGGGGVGSGRGEWGLASTTQGGIDAPDMTQRLKVTSHSY